MKFGRIRPEVIAALTQTPLVKRQVRKVAAEIRTEARRLVPVDTGNLRKNIAVENVYDPETQQVEYRVGWTKRAWYGSLVELGTAEEPAKPHLRPAANKVKNSGEGRR